MNHFPTGTVTFLFTDIEGSTKLAREHPETWETARARHHAMMREAIESNKGYVFQIIGDAFCAAFHKVGDAVKAAVKAQRVLQTSEVFETSEVLIRVRMGIHTGDAEAHGDEYRGYLTLSLVQRVMSAGHGGQILLSNATENLLRGQLPKDLTLRDMGEHKFKDVIQPVRVFQVVAPDLKSDFPVLRALDVFPNNLPTQLTSFIGREKEIAEVKQMMKDARLLTLTGAGGTGKTRLSLQVASEILQSFKDGVWFVELAPISNPELAPNTVANVLHVQEESGRPLTASLLDWLKDKESLLILDNCEHLIDACAQLVDSIVHSCPKTRVLASSREALGIAGEVAYRVPSLPLPDIKNEQIESFASAQLFIERAAQAKPDFKLTDENKDVVAQICQRLDGIPLAIELAAARVKVLSVEQIAERLDDRFRLLTGGSRTALPRQQTLRALIDWSYNLLTEEERLLFRRLAVFVGGWTLEGAESICGEERGGVFDVLDLLSRLVDKSLVIVEHVGDEVQYRRLETIRQYAREKLFDTDEAAVMRDKHLDYFMRFAERSEKILQGRGQKKQLIRLERDHDNMRAALEWSVKSRPEFGLRLAAALREFWDTHGHLTEARQWLNMLLEATKSLPPDSTRVRALVATMFFASRQTDLEGWLSILDQELTLARELGDKWGIMQGLTAHGLYKEYIEGDFENAEPLYLDCANLARELGDKLLIGQSLGPLASCALKRFEYACAESLFRESLALFREVENEKEIAGALGNLAEVAFTRREYESARVSAQESLTLYRELEDKHGIATALRTLSKAIQNQGRFEHSQTVGEQSATLFRELSDRGCLGITLPILARTILAQGNVTRAFEVAQEAATLTEVIGEYGSNGDALHVLGRIAIAQGDISNALKHFHAALTLLKQIMDTSQIPSVLEGLAYALAISSQPHNAIRLLGAADALREKTKLTITEIERPDYDRTMSLLHDQIDDASFQKIWDEGRALTMEQAIELALSST
jgi:predicted ATPase/class 3 adenylate cyclase/Flp pilus assembly protein TadD